MRKFVSRPLQPTGESLLTPASVSEPPVPAAFLWGGRELAVTAVLRRWRSTKNDRGDAYLKRHWFELQLASGGRIEVYYDREAGRGGTHWWLFAIDE